MINEKIQTAIIGISGVGGIEVVQQVQQIEPQLISSGIGIIGQIVVLIVTLIGLFKKKKEVKS